MASVNLTKLNDADFYRELGVTPGPALIFFTSAGCNSCRYWRNLLEALAVQRADLRFFEVDAQESMGLAREYDVFHLPALFLFVDGNYHAPVQCEAKLELLAKTVEHLLAGPAQDAP